jgi:hypothetical protein
MVTTIEAGGLPASFEEAKAIAQLTKNDIGFVKFESREFGKVFGRCAANTLKYCLSIIKDPNIEPFEFVFVISDNGKLERIYLSTINNLSSCFSEYMCNDNYPIFNGSGYFYHEKIVIKP